MWGAQKMSLGPAAPVQGGGAGENMGYGVPAL